MVSFHLAIIDCHWPSGSGHIEHLIWHVTSMSHIIKGSRNFTTCDSLWYVITLPSLVARGIVVVQICF